MYCVQSDSATTGPVPPSWGRKRVHGLEDDYFAESEAVHLIGIAAGHEQASVRRPVVPARKQAAAAGRVELEFGGGLGVVAETQFVRPIQLPAPHQRRPTIAGRADPEHF